MNTSLFPLYFEEVLMQALRIMIRSWFWVLSIFSSLATQPAVDRLARTPLPAENYQTFTNDGAWCWFADPRAVYHEGQRKAIYAGWVNSRGDVVIGAFDVTTGCIDTAVVHEALQKDDHANPAILIRQDGHIMVFYSKHSRPDGPMMLRISSRPEDIRHWQPEKELHLNDMASYPADYRNDYCYPNPWQLTDENNAIYLFWRGIDFKPCVSKSIDGGRTWEPGRILIMPEPTYKNRRPYVKVASNGKDRIHLVFTDGHPREEPNNSIYYVCYRDGAFYKANGEKIGDWSSLPLKPEQCDRVYHAAKAKARAWIWDLAEDGQGRPVLVYTRLPKESEHVYHYARWDGKVWRDSKIIAAGKWFPQTPADTQEREPYYSGGIVLDHHDPKVVYLSRPIEGVFEIERWVISRSGNWQKTAMTQNSRGDNVRPVVVRHNPPASAPRLLWMNNTRYVHYTDYRAAIKMDVPYVPLSAAFEANAVKSAMKRVADWQLCHPSSHPTRDWTQAAWYAGLIAWGLMADESTYLDSSLAVCERNHWKLGDRRYHADDHSVGWTYLHLYGKYGDEKMIRPLRENMDWLLAHPSSASLEFDSPHCLDRWCWCDALFMSPPVLTKLTAVTNDKKYLEFMNSEWWATTQYLYDADEHLYYRDSRYFDRRENNGAKIFWSRGNGWVIAGLARVLENLPVDYADYDKYVLLYRTMAAKIAAIQPADGLWRPSLLDAASYPQPETSGSGFFCYALAWGMNHGLLDREQYLPVVQKAWAGLVRAVHPSGKLGYVQPIGADPRQVNADMTEVYGVGAFLLAGSQVYQLALMQDRPRLEVTVTNSSPWFRPQETVEVHWRDIADRLTAIKPQQVAVFCPYENRFLVTQVLTDEQGLPSSLLFQSSWAPWERKRFLIVAKRQGDPLPDVTQRAFAMYVPQRLDDFAWENDRIAFRLYGKALEQETVSSGIDVWVKSVRYPILQKWYQSGDYHQDHGEGLDYFKVGPSRGCGGLAIWHDGRMVGSRNYRTHKILANGPIRTIFELGYQPWQVGGRQVSELKRISLDLGSNLNRIESRFTIDGDRLDVAIGLVKVQDGGEMTYNLAEGWMSYWQPMDAVNGTTGCGVVMVNRDRLRYLDAEGHGICLVTVATDQPLVYYAGAGWTKSDDFPNREAWINYVQNFARRVQHPLEIKISK